MRPRSRLLSKRGLLLPTIREAAEEPLKDLNEANALHVGAHNRPVSSEDYLLSICHLAHPTFPSVEAPAGRRRLDAVHRGLWLSGSSYAAFHFNAAGENQRNGKPAIGNPDPLEYLYGHRSGKQGTRAAFEEGRFRSPSGAARTGRGSAGEPGIGRAGDPVPVGSPKRCRPRAETKRGMAAHGGGAAGDAINPAIRHSLISQWISDCKSAWKEARLRACMLPAITEI